MKNSKNNNIFFSIVIPTYNQSELLFKAINSLVNQTYINWEAIIVDNNSTDNTDEIINYFTDIRIKKYKIRNKGIIALSRNYGIEKSKGKYICFLDTDDYWFSNKLEVVKEYILLGYNFICHGEKWLWPKGKYIFKKYRNSNKNLYKKLLFKGNNLSTSAITVEKKLLLRNNSFNARKSFIGIEDYELWLRLANDNKTKYISIEKILGVFRVHPNSNSKKLKRQLFSEINVITYHYKNFNKKNLISLFLIILRIGKTLLTYTVFGNLERMKKNI